MTTRRGDDKIVGAPHSERWLSGEFDPPGVVMAALIAKLFERS